MDWSIGAAVKLTVLHLKTPTAVASAAPSAGPTMGTSSATATARMGKSSAGQCCGDGQTEEHAPWVPFLTTTAERD
jgi:hypothetical protein